MGCMRVEGGGQVAGGGWAVVGAKASRRIVGSSRGPTAEGGGRLAGDWAGMGWRRLTGG